MYIEHDPQLSTMPNTDMNLSFKFIQRMNRILLGKKPKHLEEKCQHSSTTNPRLRGQWNNLATNLSGGHIQLS